ncbi:putative C2H2 finger domain protein [Aspergillus novofumigatus IBT 16806]|uniref:C2H2-type domain-containing protein n=1 Tax=Aspergillus novofumigatus (strain IBT 16806) TaxID=1392255 RepID=A0A2I1CKN9_ASPN1|nr:uncharacterized protein P174DRAFT_508505 [Aspergillus novofumigatus IBT 16806]PKX98190.1 hypothetical protein P174DRAFT_508505 [Aspergillus novofumigatus IBT 16806]
MASFKELSLSRPLPQSTPRHHAHSISLGAVNHNHRVTRRKSVTTAAAANAAAAAVAASMKDTNGEPIGVPMPSHRRGSTRRGLESTSVGALSGFGHYLSRSMNSPSQEPAVARKPSPNHSNNGASSVAAAGGEESSSDNKPVNTKSRNRRASEGSHLVKGEGKRALAELRCDRCGKGYKHGSCLSKHMWEHNPAWAITSKLLISKHQQVQLLEAASVLVNMNQNGPSEGAEAESDQSSASPDTSSELRDGISSAETTPPPMDEDDEDEEDMEMSGMPVFPNKRYSVGNVSAHFSHSYRSVPSSSFNGDAPLHSPAFSHFRHSSIDTRPSTAEAKLHEDDEADLAAAIGLCNFGTPRTGPVPINGTRSISQSLDPAATANDNSSLTESNPNIFLSVSYNPSLSYKVSDEREVKMGDADRVQRQNRNADVDFSNRPAHADDDDDGVFGRMEE